MKGDRVLVIWFMFMTLILQIWKIRPKKPVPSRYHTASEQGRQDGSPRPRRQSHSIHRPARPCWSFRLCAGHFSWNMIPNRHKAGAHPFQNNLTRTCYVRKLAAVLRPCPPSLHPNSTGLSSLSLSDGVASSHTLPALLFFSLSGDTFICVLRRRSIWPLHKPNAEQKLLNGRRDAMRARLVTKPKGPVDGAGLAETCTLLQNWQIKWCLELTQDGFIKRWGIQSGKGSLPPA